MIVSYVPASELEPPKQTKVCGIVLNRSSGFENVPNWSTRIFQTPKLNVGKCLQMWQNKAPWQMSRWTMWRKKFVDFTKFCKRNLYSDVRFGWGFKFVGRCEWLQVCWFWTIIDCTFDPRFDGWKKSWVSLSWFLNTSILFWSIPHTFVSIGDSSSEAGT